MRVRLRLATIGALLRYFVSRERWFLAPVLLVLVAASLLLAASSGVGQVAPFVYTLF